MFNRSPMVLVCWVSGRALVCWHPDLSASLVTTMSPTNNAFQTPKTHGCASNHRSIEIAKFTHSSFAAHTFTEKDLFG
jgi:hypothetical protein